MTDTFQCDQCGSAFSLPRAALEKYPGWTPRTCRPCRDQRQAGAPVRKTTASRTRRPDSPEDARNRHALGPADGVFTDGSSSPNPGPGGWGMVWVRAGEIVLERSGSDADTTNNRMELRALIEAYRLLPDDEDVVVHTDSQLCVNTINSWADAWARAGWKRKTGAIANLDLVQELHALAKARPRARLTWVPAHSGWRWNEYADALATQARERGLGAGRD